MWNVSVVMFGAELDLGGVGRPEHVGHRLVGLGDDRVAATARQERARRCWRSTRGSSDATASMTVSRDLGPARAVEEGDRPAVLLERQGGKAPAERGDVEGGHRVLGCGVSRS